MNPANQDEGIPASPLAMAGLRVVEFAALGPATYAAMLLADMGAEVTRIERPGAATAETRSISQRSRRAHLRFDLKEAADLDEVRSVITSADALIEGFRPGVMERLGLGPGDVSKLNPRLCYGRMTGWGQHGPLRDRAGHDINYIAAAGALHAIGPAEQPALPLNLLGDFAGGALFLVAGLLAGILAARRTGAGCVIDAAMCDGTASLMTAVHQMHADGRWSDRRDSNLLDGAAPFYRTYACADGRFVAVGALEPKFFEELSRGIGLDARWLNLRDDRAHWNELQAEMAALFRRKTRDEWTALLEHVDACVTPVRSIAESFEDPHLKARRTFISESGRQQAARVPRFAPLP